MTTHSRRQFRVLTIAIAIIALLFGLWTFHQGDSGSKSIELENGTLIPIPHDISPFELVNDNAKPFTNKSLKGKWSVLFFGFTKCPMLCPTTLSTLDKVYKLMAKNGVKQLPQIVFISVDPDRDTPSSIKQYLSSFNANFIGATGNKAALKKLTTELNILFMKVAKDNTKDANDYVIDHSGTLLLINPNAQLAAVFATPHDAVKLSKDLQTIEENYHA